MKDPLLGRIFLLIFRAHNQKQIVMKKMTLLKTIIIVTFLTVMTCIVMTSCSSSRRGCYDTRGLVGYK